eukprot:8837007-Ditylum_brightwellii.AAC.1
MVTSKPGVANLSDILTKLLKGPHLRELSQRLLWYLDGSLDGPGQEGDQVPGTGTSQIVRGVM